MEDDKKEEKQKWDEEWWGERITEEIGGAVTAVTVKADRLLIENYQTLFYFTIYIMCSRAHS